MTEQLQHIDMPEVVRLEQPAPGSVTLLLRVDPAINVFAGHFDVAPILPGIVQLHWALAFCAEYLQPVKPADVAHIDALKFQQVIQPGAELTLTLDLATDHLSFRFTSVRGNHSSGKVVLDR